jgi:hypothetical protein
LLSFPLNYRQPWTQPFDAYGHQHQHVAPERTGMIYQLIDEYSLINYLAAGLAKVLMAVLVAIDQFDLQGSNEKTTN